MEIRCLFLLKTLHHNVGFVPRWISVVSPFQLLHPLVPERSLSFRQLHRFVCMVLMHGIHFILHGTQPIAVLGVPHCFFKAFWVPLIRSTIFALLPNMSDPGFPSPVPPSILHSNPIRGLDQSRCPILLLH